MSKLFIIVLSLQILVLGCVKDNGPDAKKIKVDNSLKEMREREFADSTNIKRAWMRLCILDEATKKYVKDEIIFGDKFKYERIYYKYDNCTAMEGEFRVEGSYKFEAIEDSLMKKVDIEVDRVMGDSELSKYIEGKTHYGLVLVKDRVFKMSKISLEKDNRPSLENQINNLTATPMYQDVFDSVPPRPYICSITVYDADLVSIEDIRDNKDMIDSDQILHDKKFCLDDYTTSFNISGDKISLHDNLIDLTYDLNFSKKIKPMFSTRFYLLNHQTLEEENLLSFESTDADQDVIKMSDRYIYHLSCTTGGKSCDDREDLL